MGALQPGHLLIVLLIFAPNSSTKKLPEAARGLGRSARILKSEMSGIHDEDKPGEKSGEAKAEKAETKQLESARPTESAPTESKRSEA